MTEGFQEQTIASQTVDSQSGDDLTDDSSIQATADDGASTVADVEAVEPGQTTQRVAAMVVGLVLLLCLVLGALYSLRSSDPYIQSVLAMSGNADRGHDIFQLNCATCHGLEALGEVGPDLRNISARRSRVALIEQVISGQTPPMPQFQPNERDMADLLAFLETL